MKTFFLGLMMAVAYFVFAKVSAYFGEIDSIVNIGIFVPEAIALAGALLFGPRIVWGIFVGQTLFALSNDLGFVSASLIGVSNTIEALIAIKLARYWKIDLAFNDLRSVLYFFALVTFILQPFSAIGGNIALALYGYKFWLYVISWYFGNIIAQLVITPVLLLLYKAYRDKKLEIIKIIAVVTISILISYIFVTFLHLNNVVLLFSLSVVATLIVAYNLGKLYGAITINALSIIMLVLNKYGVDIFSSQSELENIINLNFYMIGQVFIFYTVEAMYEEKKRLLSSLQKYNKELESRVKAEVAKNREKEKALLYQSRLAQIGETINMIAHQWRQPLNNISIMQQAMTLKYKNGSLSSEDMSEIQKKIYSQIDYMSDTINSFRDFFKPEKEIEKFNIRDVISHILSISRPEIEKNHISLSYYQNVEVTTQGYPNELGQALLSIINNAKDQLLFSACEEKEITVEVEVDEKNISIKISDTGGGIKDDVMEKLFEPYFSTKGKNGTGLGLYIAKMIIEEHMNGSISVKNSDKGAVFTIDLLQNSATSQNFS